MKKNKFPSLLIIGIHVAFFLIVLVIVSTDLIAQPPNFPTAPDQTPIDGGLGAVALGLGGWAIKKLRANVKK